MKKIGKVAMAIFASLLIFYPAAAAAGAQIAEMKDDVVAAGGDWAAIEALLDSLSPEDRELVIATYPERLAELAEVRRAIEESGAKWTAGLTTVSILPPELRPGTGPSINPEGIRTIWPTESSLSTDDLPAAWDWRNVNGSNWMTPIKNHGDHSTASFFAALGAVEPRMKLAANNPELRPDLSEQYLISCGTITSIDNNSSKLIAQELTYFGTVDDACFRYDGLNVPPCTDSCFDRDSRKYKIEGWAWVSGDPDVIDVARIKQEILFGGPVSSNMTVFADFWNYKSGIYNHTTGNQIGTLVVVILGWGSENGTDYWICKNSMGTGFGDNGWFKIKMGEVDIGSQAIAYQPKIRGKVLFYEGHGPVYALIGNYSEWGNRLAGNGYLVHINVTTPLTLDLLSCYDVVVIGNPEVAFTADELAAIKAFVGRGRVIAAGDGDLFTNGYIYKQDNVKAAVQYVDWLATGDGGGLLLLGGEDVDWLPSFGPAEETEPLVTNFEINQVANLFGLTINSDVIYDPLRYDGEKSHAILGPKENILVINGSSLSISKDAFPLARTTSSGYAQAATLDATAAVDLDLPPAGELTPPSVFGEDDIITPPRQSRRPVVMDLDADGEMVTASGPVPLAGLAFAGPIGIAAIDFGRKGEDTVGVFRDGVWYLDYDNDGIADFFLTFGLPGYSPATGDWSGDGKDTLGVFKDGVWSLDYNNDGIADSTVNFGAAGDIPVTGDWNGDGRDTVGVFKDGVWSLDYNNDGISDLTVNFGAAGDIPVTGDWNGDGRDTIGIFKDGVWSLDYNNDGISDLTVNFGAADDIPVTGDWNGNGRDTIGVFKDGIWRLDYDNDGVADSVVTLGPNDGTPVTGDWYKIETREKWFELSGYVTSPPSMIVDDQGRDHIFAIGGDNALWDNVDGVWHYLGGGLASAPFSLKDSDGKIHVLVKGADSSLYNLVFDTETWTASWYGFGGCIADMPTATKYGDNGNLIIMVRACDDSLWAFDLTDTTTMNGYWINLGGNIRGVPFVIEDTSGKIHTLARCCNNLLWDLVIDAPGSYNWHLLGGDISTEQLMPTAVQEPGRPGHLAIMVRGTDNALKMCDLSPDMTPTWTSMGGNIQSGGYVITDTSGNIHTFTKIENAAWENVFSSSPWDPDGGNWHYHGCVLHSSPWNPVAFANGLTHMAFVGSDSALYKKVYPTIKPVAVMATDDELRGLIDREPEPTGIRYIGPVDDISGVTAGERTPVEIEAMTKEVATFKMSTPGGNERGISIRPVL